MPVRCDNRTQNNTFSIAFERCAAILNFIFGCGVNVLRAYQRVGCALV